MGRSDAQKAADARYKKENRALLAVELSKQEVTAINNFVNEVCKPSGVSKARFVFWACNYFIRDGITPPESEVLQEYTSADDLNDNNGGNG